PFHIFFFLLLRPPPRSPLFPYTTLFRSVNTATTSACPHESDLRDLAAGLCPEPAASRLTQHAATCDRCGVLLRSYAEDFSADLRSEEHTSELQSLTNLVCRLLLEKKNITVEHMRHSNGIVLRPHLCGIAYHEQADIRTVGIGSCSIVYLSHYRLACQYSDSLAVHTTVQWCLCSYRSTRAPPSSATSHSLRLLLPSASRLMFPFSLE